jgi:hypothetical protein
MKASKTQAAAEVAVWERLAEAGYDRIYDAHDRRAAKEAYEDACEGFIRAMETAKAAGMWWTRRRLRKRFDHVVAVYTRQFR